ncbi:MAG: FtsH protease activity modulator HflK [Magnetospiraceae bacterium]
MAWNSQGGGPWGGGGNGQGPWGGGNGGSGGGGGPSGQMPPDLEDMIRKSQDRIKKFVPGGGNGLLPGGFRSLTVVVLLAVIVWGFFGMYRVQPGEQGVELLFGEFVKTTESGLHFWFPPPIGSVEKPNVEKTNVITIGYRGSGDVRGDLVRDVPQESLMITGDQNIVDVDFMVQWRISSAADYLFNIRDPETTIKAAAESAIREVVGQMPLENTLSLARGEVQDKTRVILQEILNKYNAGVAIADVKLQKTEPPSDVIDAFNDVQRARQDQERLVNEATAYRNDIVPRARGQAKRMIEDASAYKERVVRDAEGEANRFLSVLEAYKTGREVTSQRLYLEAMQSILGKSEKVIIDPSGEGGSGGVVPYLPLPEVQKRRTGGAAQ